MPQKPSIGMDLLSTAWVVFVAVIYYGGYANPQSLGVFTGPGCAVYGAVLLIAVVAAARRYLSGARSNTVEDSKKA
jgi:hypothetical protein